MEPATETMDRMTAQVTLDRHYDRDPKGPSPVSHDDFVRALRTKRAFMETREERKQAKKEGVEDGE